MKLKKTIKIATLIAASTVLVKVLLEDNKNKKSSNEINKEDE